ncbi:MULTISPECIES: response regulator [unclassified Mesorhizobium]|uniref:response regulator n=1 Tax=unclassified Mesorhizobium TaxID=325217 RepID=UPI0018DDF49C|nr:MULTISPECIES: response regulator [unclassified Mesorhizobium]WJI52994.1 response regulator [Mesorhizobium sp. C089B]
MGSQSVLSVVVLEDEALIALDVEQSLCDAGFNVLAVLSSCSEALEWLQSNSPDVAVLDIELNDGNCDAVARLLYERNIPFVVHSGSAFDPRCYDPIFQKGTWVSKPAGEGDVTNAVAACASMATG